MYFKGRKKIFRKAIHFRYAQKQPLTMSPETRKNKEEKKKRKDVNPLKTIKKYDEIFNSVPRNFW